MLICVTDRKLCKENFTDRIGKIARLKPHAIILREKDLSEAHYEKLLSDVKDICVRYGVSLYANTFFKAAERAGVRCVHLPMPVFKEFRRTSFFEKVGVSVHSVEEAEFAERKGADYVICGHIFPTDCKKGLEARGLSFVRSIRDAVSVPVFAIGGIDENNAESVMESGADGVCVMSTLMTCSEERMANIFRKTLVMSTKR